MSAELQWGAAMADLALRAGRRLEGAPAPEIVAWADETFGEGLVVTTSLQDAVLTHLAASVRPGVDVVFVDTGYHFVETIGMRDAVAATYPVNFVSVTPAQTVAEQDATYGPRLHATDPDLCCTLRKVEPLSKALAPYTAWMTGLRRTEAPTRRHAGVVEWDARRGMVKVNPIASWTDDDVAAYIAEHGILENPLVGEGYASIGCAPCTRKVLVGEPARAGRWSGTGKVECGLHG
jgi:phosphoadenosine phosphosulfate reductase